MARCEEVKQPQYSFKNGRGVGRLWLLRHWSDVGGLCVRTMCAWLLRVCWVTQLGRDVFVVFEYVSKGFP